MVRKFGGDIQHYLRTHSRRGTWRNSPIFLDAKQKTHLYSASFIHLCFMSVTMMHKNADFTIYYISQYQEDDVSVEQVDELFSKYNADVDKSLAEQDLYLMVFPDAMSYEQINSLVEELEADPIIYGAGPDVIGDVDEMLGEE